eukprot:TRINITY_DN11644_c0_g1_i1.p1 TRINITY_DN11644_c0_g1~~TRINITY_DN11644_c0_g1_i1.p1  ORF type:complete len:133 (-),score=25.44 TRINITY_DN11644_c0_g1_i1:72-470(-)
MFFFFQNKTMEESGMDLLSDVHQKLVEYTRACTIESDKEKANKYELLDEFFEAVDKIESYLVVLDNKNHQNVNLAKEVQQMELELQQKDNLIEKYAVLIPTWEQEFRHLISEQNNLLRSQVNEMIEKKWTPN